MRVLRKHGPCRRPAKVGAARTNDHNAGFYQSQACREPIAVSLSQKPLRALNTSDYADFCFYFIDYHWSLPKTGLLLPAHTAGFHDAHDG
jgi:hypothetical protein